MWVKKCDEAVKRAEFGINKKTKHYTKWDVCEMIKDYQILIKYKYFRICFSSNFLQNKVVYEILCWTSSI